MFECNHVIKLSQFDDYEDGCTGGINNHGYDYTTKGKTLEEVKKAIANHIGCCKDDITVNPSGDDPSRIDVQTQETEDGFIATASDIEQWREGKLKLWCCDYIFRFDEVTRTSANFGA